MRPAGFALALLAVLAVAVVLDGKPTPGPSEASARRVESLASFVRDADAAAVAKGYLCDTPEYQEAWADEVCHRPKRAPRKVEPPVPAYPGILVEI